MLNSYRNALVIISYSILVYNLVCVQCRASALVEQRLEVRTHLLLRHFLIYFPPLALEMRRFSLHGDTLFDRRAQHRTELLCRL